MKKKTISVILVLAGILIFNSGLAAGYFQQEVNYKIKVRLNDVNHSLSAYIEFEYINNSPDALNEIWIHLWPNAYKDRTSALAKQQVEDGNLKLYFAKDNERGFIDSLDFKVDGNKVIFEFKEIDYGRIILKEPLMPGKRIVISSPFYIKIPDAKFSRLGHDKQAYYITQWYPKPAVYDKKGWHMMPYLDQGEFYSEFGTFDVTIELPKNYVVGATGELIGNTVEYDWLTGIAEKTAIKESFTKDMSFPKSDPEFKTLNYRQDNVHDFAWFADKRFNVLKGEVILPHSKRKVTTWTMFTNDKAEWWGKSIEYINDAIYYYSLWNGDYGYNSCTAIDGVISAGTGMEYPMITIVGGESDSLMLEIVIAHEVGHNWFYGMLASNEREHPWMDEGINSFNEGRCILTKYPKETFGNINELMLSGKTATKLLGLNRLDYMEAWQLEYNIAASTHSDQPIEGHSVNYTALNYGIITYRKAGVAFELLRNYLGEAMFDSCMQLYFETWKFKHPYPEDFKAVITKASGKNLDWFFNDLLPTNKPIDYSICGIKRNGHNFKLKINNKTNFEVPFELHGLKNDSIISTMRHEGFINRTHMQIKCDECDAFEIDYLHKLPEANRKNNRIRTHGILKKIEPLAIGMLPKFDSKSKTKFNVLPSVGWNEYNKWMAGITVYDRFLPFKKFEYAFSPLYGFGDKDIAGLASIELNVFPTSGAFDFLGVAFKGKRFAYFNALTRTGEENFENITLHYNRVEQSIQFSLRNKVARSKINNRFSISAIQMFTEDVVVKERINLTDSTHYNITGAEDNFNKIFRVGYEHKNNRTLDPYKILLQYEGNSEFGKVRMTAGFKFNYSNSSKGIEGRIFAGSFIYNDKDANIQYPFHLSGWSGESDYWADEYYFGRSETEGLSSQQMSMYDGGFKLYVPYARTTSWLGTVNLKAALPGKLPLKLFFDAGTFENAGTFTGIEEYDDKFLWDGGLCFSLVNDALEVFIPLIKSKGIKNYYEDQEIKFSEQIRFIIKLDAFNPLNTRNQIFQ